MEIRKRPPAQNMGRILAGGMAAEDFPEMPTVGSDKTIVIDADIFSEMVKGTIFAVAQNEGAKPILTGIYVTIEDRILRFVAIDGYRLAIRRHNIDIEGSF